MYMYTLSPYTNTNTKSRLKHPDSWAYSSESWKFRRKKNCVWPCCVQPSKLGHTQHGCTQMRNLMEKKFMHVWACSVCTLHVCTQQIYSLLIYNLLFWGANQGASVIMNPQTGPPPKSFTAMRAPTGNSSACLLRCSSKYFLQIKWFLTHRAWNFFLWLHLCEQMMIVICLWFVHSVTFRISTLESFFTMHV